MCLLRMGLLLTSGLHVHSYVKFDQLIGWNVTERILVWEDLLQDPSYTNA